MLLTFIPTATYALPAVAGAVLIPIVIEAGAGSGWMVYAAVALLSLFISSDKEAAILFISFFGYYPVLKSQLEWIPKRWIEWFVKLVIFNVTMIASYLLMLYVFNLDIDSFTIGGVNLSYAFLAAGNVVFVIYDLALTNVISAYMRLLHPKLVKIFHLNQK